MGEVQLGKGAEPGALATRRAQGFWQAAVTAAFDFYRYADPERSLSTRLTLFPSLTESGRIRSEFRTTFKLELISNLFWSMELYYQGDNDPPSAEATKSDYGVTTSIGWSL